MKLIYLLPLIFLISVSYAQEFLLNFTDEDISQNITIDNRTAQEKAQGTILSFLIPLIILGLIITGVALWY